MINAFIFGGLIVFFALTYLGRAYWGWVLASAAWLYAWVLTGGMGSTGLKAVSIGVLTAAILFGFKPLRRALISSTVMKLVAKILPKMGDTERIAMEAGTVWWDGELFSGDPDWKKLLRFEMQPLSEREQAYIDGPVETLCQMLDDWQIHQDRDLPQEVWDYIKKEKFFAMIIPEEYGGLGFSAIGNSAVVAKISSRSVPAAVTVMVPNSLGPGELLMKYGTEEQRNHYLPRLAAGDEIPCFALTSPEAGSDAATENTESIGTVCKDTFGGKEVLGIRLNWRKRYITLAPVATVIGLAFHLFDPDGFLGGEEKRGITCALIPRDVTGITIGDQHDPMGVPFKNGPIFGKGVFIPLDFVIGGVDGVGQGWMMLMDCLAAGRAISLPALSVGAAQLATRVTGAYGTIREQFNTPIGRFEGIEEGLARIGGMTYFMDATRKLTCAAVDAGEKPAVLSAIAKAYLTDGMRTVMTDAMDIRAGSAICRGPRNTLGRAFISIPVGITVEGANILTRSLIIYGQGAIRCHPFVHDEMEAVGAGDLDRFDAAFFGHVNFVYKNGVRAFILALTGGSFVGAPLNGVTGGYLRQLTRYSAAFALISDVCLGVMGGSLKRREKITGRLADALSWMYMASAAIKRFNDEGRPAADEAYLKWSCDKALWEIQEALCGVIDNFPVRLLAWKMRWLIFPWGMRRRPPADDVGGEIAASLLDGNEGRDRLTGDIYIPSSDENGLGTLEATLAKVVTAQPAARKIKSALRDGTLAGKPSDTLYDEALAQGVLTAEECLALKDADEARDNAIQVDFFDPEAFLELKG
jgi:acyl-CoA dehydrogenase